MKTNLAKLIELKSIITLLLILTLVVVVLYLTFTGQLVISPDFFVGVVMAVVTYYFTRSNGSASKTLNNNIAVAEKPPDGT